MSKGWRAAARFAFLGWVCAAVCGGAVLASSSGIASFSGNPNVNGGLDCNACHVGGIAPAVSLSGPTFVMPATVNTYTLTISGGQEVEGGFDVSVTAGGLQAFEQGTKLLSGEVVHSTPRAVVGGTVSWSFNWRAPNTTGPVTFYGAGNSVNGAQGDNGDRAATDVLEVLVTNAIPGPGETSGPGLAPLLVTGYDDVTGHLSIEYQSACQATDNNIYYGPLSQVDTWGWNGEDCAIGTTGSYGSFDPGPGSYFFVVVGTRGSDEGSYGRGSNSFERPPFVGSLCGQVQLLVNTCE